MSNGASWLRKQPRQQRSMDRIEALLDTAAIVFEDVGYDNATTNLIAERADIPVATLYRWFPDKAALAAGLTARYLEQLTDTYTALINTAAPEMSLLRVAVEDLAALVRQNPALPAIMAASDPSGPGEILRSTLQGAIGTVIGILVPTAEPVDIERIGRLLTTVTFAVFGDALRLDDAGYAAVVDEFTNLVSAWMSARFPPADDPIWLLENPAVPPLAPSPRADARTDLSNIDVHAGSDVD